MSTDHLLIDHIRQLTANDAHLRSAINNLDSDRLSSDSWLELLLVASSKPYHTVMYVACKIVEDRIKWKVYCSTDESSILYRSVLKK